MTDLSNFSAAASYGVRKWGVFSPFVPLADGTGMLFGVPYLLGTASAYNIDTDHGTYTTYDTSAVATPSQAGYHGYQLITKSAFRPVFRCKFSLSNTANCRAWFGFSSSAGPTNYPTGDDAFNGKSGFALSKRAADTVWQIAHNDGTGSTSFDPLDGNPAVDTNVHTILVLANIDYTGTLKFYYNLDEGISSQIISSDIPLDNDFLTITACIENSVASLKSVNIHWMDFLTDR